MRCYCEQFFSKARPLFSLCMQFFATEPYACEPSSLPQYPPSKEMDAKRRDEEARRFVALTHKFISMFCICCSRYSILSPMHKQCVVM
jgi:hypothetical protein